MKRKGFEPIIAALLLVIITIIAAAAIYLWSSGLTSGAGAGAAKFAFQAEVYDTAIADAPSGVENATGVTDDTNEDDLVVRVILKNTGNSPIVITDLKVRDLTKGTDFVSVKDVAIIAVGGTNYKVADTYTLNPGEVVDTTIYIIDITGKWSGVTAEPGDKFELLFVFSDGTTYSIIVQTRGA